MFASIASGLCAAGATITAAVYTNFSWRVMPRLKALPDAEGITTMQQFNRNALQPPFMTAFFGAAALSSALVIRTLRHDTRTHTDWLCATGASLYLAGFVLTIAYNVPRNDALAGLDVATPRAAEVWRTYVAEWTTANTIRAALSIAAAVLLTAAAVAFTVERTHSAGRDGRDDAAVHAVSDAG